MDIYKRLIGFFSCYPNMFTVPASVTVVFGVPIYIYLLIVLFLSRKTQPFDSIFYYQVRVMGVVDILYIVHTYIFLKLPDSGTLTKFYTNFMPISRSYCPRDRVNSHDMLGCTKPYSIFPTYGQFMTVVLGFCQPSGITLISLNRLLETASPISEFNQRVPRSAIPN